MLGKAGIASAALVLLVAIFLAVSGGGPQMASAAPLPAPSALPAAVRPLPPAAVVPPPVNEVLQSGVLIVISKPTQQMFVFKDGDPWGSSPVSTGKRGKATPAGVFPILQKKVFHRSNLYSNAPMPHMQRLTWSGIAIHAGHLPGYPASHGCIRVPRRFAKELFALTRPVSTTVVVTNERVVAAEFARTLALATPRTGDTRLAAVAGPRIEPLPLFPIVDPGPSIGQTIQLAAATSPGLAEAHWARLQTEHPQLAGFSMRVEPAVVGARQVYRLRTTAPGAHALCSTLKQAGEACFNVS